MQHNVQQYSEYYKLFSAVIIIWTQIGGDSSAGRQSVLILQQKTGREGGKGRRYASPQLLWQWRSMSSLQNRAWHFTTLPAQAEAGVAQAK